jgi:hypothetical protein
MKARRAETALQWPHAARYDRAHVCLGTYETLTEWTENVSEQDQHTRRDPGPHCPRPLLLDRLQSDQEYIG